VFAFGPAGILVYAARRRLDGFAPVMAPRAALGGYYGLVDGDDLGMCNAFEDGFAALKAYGLLE
jgi:hypothetical protein